MSSRTIAISATDGGEFGAYLALPAEGPAPGIVMLHEIFGVTDWIRETADLFAAHGYCVAAPDMFWRMEAGFAGDFRDPDQVAKGRGFKADIDHDKAMDDIAAAAAMLRTMPECNGRIGVTGFCTGGTLAYLAAARLKPDAAVAYYGTQIHEFLGEAANVACPAVFHMGTDDDRVPADTPVRLREALAGVPDATIHLYDAGHAFCHTERDDLYSEAASRSAHARTFEFFDRLR